MVDLHTPVEIPEAEVQRLLLEAGLSEAAGAADRDLLAAARLACALGRALGLDARTSATLLHYLRRIDRIEHELRAQHAPPRTTPGVTHQGPAPWHEPHGSGRAPTARNRPRG
jgi:hypothetical protein